MPMRHRTHPVDFRDTAASILLFNTPFKITLSERLAEKFGDKAHLFWHSLQCYRQTEWHV